jgi:hypothetical protein
MDEYERLREQFRVDWGPRPGDGHEHRWVISAGVPDDYSSRCELCGATQMVITVAGVPRQ